MSPRRSRRLSNLYALDRGDPSQTDPPPAPPAPVSRPAVRRRRLSRPESVIRGCWARVNRCPIPRWAIWAWAAPRWAPTRCRRWRRCCPRRWAASPALGGPGGSPLDSLGGLAGAAARWPGWPRSSAISRPTTTTPPSTTTATRTASDDNKGAPQTPPSSNPSRPRRASSRRSRSQRHTGTGRPARGRPRGRAAAHLGAAARRVDRQRSHPGVWRRR